MSFAHKEFLCTGRISVSRYKETLTNVGAKVGILLGLPVGFIVVGATDGEAVIGASVGRSELGDIVESTVATLLVLVLPGVDALTGLDGVGLGLFDAGFGAVCVVVAVSTSSTFVASSAAIAESFPQRVASIQTSPSTQNQSSPVLMYLL